MAAKVTITEEPNGSLEIYVDVGNIESLGNRERLIHVNMAVVSAICDYWHTPLSPYSKEQIEQYLRIYTRD